LIEEINEENAAWLDFDHLEPGVKINLSDMIINDIALEIAKILEDVGTKRRAMSMPWFK